MDTLAECPVCDSADLGLRCFGRTTRNPSDPAEWRVAECRSCGLGFLNPRPSWQELEPYYSAQYAAYSHSHGAKADDEAVIAEARRTGRFRHIPIPEGKRVLDVGCGGGYFLRICSKLGATVQGIEPSPIAAEQTRSQGIPVHYGMIDTLTTRMRYDVITASQVLEHAPDPVAMLAKMRLLLAPGGMIWLAVPNADCCWAKVLGWKWDGADLPYHLLHFGSRSMETAAKRARACPLPGSTRTRSPLLWPFLTEPTCATATAFPRSSRRLSSRPKGSRPWAGEWMPRMSGIR